MKSLKINLNSVSIEAQPRQMDVRWARSYTHHMDMLHLEKDKEFVMSWLSLHTDYQLVMTMLDRGGMEAIEFIGFERLEELAEAFPSLAKRLADPTGGRNA